MKDSPSSFSHCFKMEDEMCYNMNHVNQGLAVIFNNKEFTYLSNRCGADKDTIRMKKMFKRLGFKIKLYSNLSAARMKEKLTKASKHPLNKSSNCFVCVISSHGNEEHLDTDVHSKMKVKQQVIWGSNGKKDYVPLQELVEIMRYCKDLRDKPKLFFIQACRVHCDRKSRTDGIDLGTDVHIKEFNGQGSKEKKYSDAMDSKGDDSSVVTNSEENNEGESDLSDTEIEDSSEDEEHNEDVSGEDTHLGHENTPHLGHEDTHHLGHENTHHLGHEDTHLEHEDTHLEHEDTHVVHEDQADVKHSDSQTPAITTYSSGNITRETAGKHLERDKTDTQHSSDTLPLPPPLMEVTHVPCYNDMLIMYASPRGYIAIRNTNEGSYFLQYLYSGVLSFVDSFKCGALKTWPDLLHILTQVTHNLAMDVETNLKFRNPVTEEVEMELKGKCIPCIVHRLRKDIILKPKGQTKWNSETCVLL